MKIEDLTIGQAQEIAALFGPAKKEQTHSFEVGKCYLIRTVSMHYTGRVANITDFDIALDDAAWIADTGRFADCLKTGLPTNAEVEPFPNRAYVARQVIVDFAPWGFDLPREQK